eukprot:77879-Pelagomonas_calceolata.AAC.2
MVLVIIDDVQGHLVVPAWISRAAGFEPVYSAGMLGTCSFQSGKEVNISAGFNSTRPSKGNVIIAVHSAAEWAACRGGRPLEPDGMLLCVNCFRAAFYTFTFCLRVIFGWFQKESLVQPLPAIVILATGFSRATLVSFVHVCFKLICPVGEVVNRSSVGIELQKGITRGLQPVILAD